MRSLASVLLGFEMAAQLLSRLQPIPFLGFAVGLLGFPLAAKISFQDLFYCEFVNLVFGFALRFEMMLLMVNSGFMYVDPAVFSGMWLLIVIPFLLAAAAGSAFTMKLLSRFTPKRLKYVVMGI